MKRKAIYLDVAMIERMEQRFGECFVRKDQRIFLVSFTYAGTRVRSERESTKFN